MEETKALCVRFFIFPFFIVGSIVGGIVIIAILLGTKIDQLAIKQCPKTEGKQCPACPSQDAIESTMVVGEIVWVGPWNGHDNCPTKIKFPILPTWGIKGEVVETVINNARVWGYPVGTKLVVGYDRTTQQLTIDFSKKFVVPATEFKKVEGNNLLGGQRTTAERNLFRLFLLVTF